MTFGGDSYQWGGIKSVEYESDAAPYKQDFLVICSVLILKSGVECFFINKFWRGTPSGVKP